ncbi:MAG: hypothetical protein GY950_31545 [bacterium]|nr:hypothetical protein [bacterium]
MKRVVITSLVVMLLVSFTFHCSKDEDKAAAKKVQKKKPLPLKPEIAKVEIDPAAPISTSFVRAVPVLKHARMRFVNYSYQWYVNDQEVPEGNRKLLDKKHFRKGDTIYCRVKAARGKYESEELDSEDVEIGNAPPTINVSTVSAFNVPGEFRYTIRATDPDEDGLSYRLLEPLDRGIALDANTGDILWYIDRVPEDLEAGESDSNTRPEDESGEVRKKPEPKPKENKLSSFVKIVFEVSDTDGAAAVASINLNLAKGSEQPE